MPSEKKARYQLKKGKYANVREGNSHFLNLTCSKCNQHLALYQKDGRGGLVRLYLDRIFEPSALSLLQLTISSKSEMPNLKCSKCDTLIGMPMVYEPEKRLAFRLIRGTFTKKKLEAAELK